MRRGPRYDLVASNTPREPASARRGTVLVWFVLIVPMMMLILFALTDYATMSLARVELKNAVDAAALSGVKSWTQQGASAAERDAEVIFAANTVISPITSPAASGIGASGVTRVAEVRETTAGADVATAISGIFLGYVEDSDSRHIFHDLSSAADLALPTDVTFARCVCVRKTIQVASLTSNWLGVSLGPYVITADSFARVHPETGEPQLVFVDGFALTEP